LHQVVGIRKPGYTYQDFQNGNAASLNDIVVEHHQYDQLGFIFGAAGSYGMANEKYFHRQKFLKQLRSLESEYVILDLGAGSSFQVLDLFLAADLGIVVVNPDPLSLAESFNFIKQVIIRNLSNTLRTFPDAQAYIYEQAKNETFRSTTRVSDIIATIQQFRPEAAEQMRTCLNKIQIGIILNKVNEDAQVTETEALQKALQELLSINTDLLGIIHYDTTVQCALEAGTPFIAKDAKAESSRDLANIIITKLLHRDRFHAFWDKMSMRKKFEEPSEYGNRVICSINCLYWDECGYRQGGYPCKLQHMAEMGFQGE
ncbi:MAG: hypothetical protein JW774_05800, partial [Candidatus Aureabacteria bacterium]|nr:hypothetical protein [Candidatus Auribacterota bacterium]